MNWSEVMIHNLHIMGAEHTLAAMAAAMTIE